ncbi:MAG: hypothetical protein ACK4MJ_03770 [Hylemonella sp.]
MAELLAALVSTASPLLPAPALARAYLALGWGLVLAAALAWGLRQRAAFAGWRRALPGLLLLWSLLPLPLTPPHLLGLAFQAPSLTLALWAAWALAAAYRPHAAADCVGAALQRHAAVFAGLGTLLVLDALALLPGLPLYAWGYAPAVVALLAALAGLPWLLQRGAALSGLLGAALLLYVALRLPSGNVWDALLDPWLVLILLVRALRRPLR